MVISELLALAVKQAITLSIKLRANDFYSIVIVYVQKTMNGSLGRLPTLSNIIWNADCF